MAIPIPETTMPTEHEYKYLLDRSEETVRRIEGSSVSRTYIEQAYLASGSGLSVRIRHAKKNSHSTWTLTIKQDVGRRVVEIETELDPRDAKDLWKKCKSHIRKVRHHLHDTKGRLWEVDVFLTESGASKDPICYCVMAEIELPENADRPDDPPDFIREHLVHEVSLGDKRFANKRLWKVDKVNGLYSRLGRQK